MNSVIFLRSLKIRDFDAISRKTGKGKVACFRYWMGNLAPILLSNALGLPQDGEWRKEVFKYIIEKKFVGINEIPYNKIIRDICPGQTNKSVTYIIDPFRHVRYVNTSLHEYCKKQLTNPYSNSFLGNEELMQAKSEYASKIIKIKENLAKINKEKKLKRTKIK